jgi:hypothetical protein
MIPAGYMAKRTKKPLGFDMDSITEVYSVSSCVNDDFADYVPFWKHNGYWLFDSPEIIRTVARENSITLEETRLFYYEVHEEEFKDKNWFPFKPEASLITEIIAPANRTLEGYDVVTFSDGDRPECSPLSCNGMAGEIRTNPHCLLDSFDEAHSNIAHGVFNNSEPGPYRIFAVYSTPWPEPKNADNPAR